MSRSTKSREEITDLGIRVVDELGTAVSGGTGRVKRILSSKGRSVGHVVAIVAIAALALLLLDSHAALHSAQGMKPGAARTAVVGVLSKVDAFSSALWLDRPSKLLSSVFGHEWDATNGRSLTDGSGPVLPAYNSSLQQQAPLPGARFEPTKVVPTVSDPLRVLVAGDERSAFLGQQLDDLSSDRRLVRVQQDVQPRSGMTSPEFVNWLALGSDDVHRLKSQAVVMALGYYDTGQMTHNGQTLSPASPEWEDEYARRVAVVSTALIDAGAQRIYWVAPARTGDPTSDERVMAINRAVGRAAAAVPGVRDIEQGVQATTHSSTSGQDHRSTFPTDVGASFADAQIPARLVADVITADYGQIL